MRNIKRELFQKKILTMVDNYTLKKFLSRKKKKNPDQLAEKYGNFLETKDKMNPSFRDMSGH